MSVKKIYIVLIALVFINFHQNTQAARIKLGLDVLMEQYLYLLHSKRVAVITNQTSINTDETHIAVLLHEAEDVNLVALFSPEHGIRGDVEGGYHIDTQTDSSIGLPVFSLYGKTKKPVPEILENIEILIFDIQDIGARFYTYISTMSLAMEAAAENDIPFIVLDRPNPITGEIIEGPVLEPGFESFVGIHQIALRHGMTVGELANLFNNEGFLNSGIKADLTVIKMENWQREFSYDELDLGWIKPSPNIPDIATAFLYPGIGLLEATNVSEGRGTPYPFKNIGAPWLDNHKLLTELQKLNISGISAVPTTFIPMDISGTAVNPKYEGQRCFGLHFTVTEPKKFFSVAFGIQVISLVKKLHPEQFAWISQRAIDIMAGTDKLRLAIDNAVPADQIINSWQDKLTSFQDIRKKYLLYE